jgi:hypothetical protein
VRDHAGPDSGRRSSVPRFAFVGSGDPLMLLLLFQAMLFGRAGKSGCPSPLEPSLKVHRDTAHNQSSRFVVPPPPGVKGLNARGFKGLPGNGASANQR